MDADRMPTSPAEADEKPRSFRVGDLVAGGMSRHRVDTRFDRPYWGLRTETPDFSPDGRSRLFLPRLPEGGFFSHGTAAQLWSLPVPRRLEREARPHVSVPAARRAVDTADAVGHAVLVRPGDVMLIEGIPVSSPARVWRELSAVLTLPELVALGDSLLHSGLAFIDELGRETARRRFRGRRNAVAALPLLDGAAETPPESELRTALVLAGMPRLLVNVPLYDAAGRFVAKPDLRCADYPVAFEYDGDGHRTDVRQWRKDVHRYAAIEDLGLDVVRATGDDLPHFDRVIRRGFSRLRRHGWTP